MEQIKFNLSNEEFWTTMSIPNSEPAKKLRNNFAESLKNIHYEFGFMEFPIYEATKQTTFLIIDASNKFKNKIHDSSVFNSYFTNDKLCITTLNLKKDALMVIPTINGGNTNYLNILSFIRTANYKQIDALLCELGIQVCKQIKINKPIYVSTHGLGVYWLHIRIENTPKYYCSIKQ